MDPTRDILFRGYALNSTELLGNGGGGIGSGISGCVVDSVDMGDVDVVQFAEKRSQSDGMDVGDVFLGMRRIQMSGTLYGTTRALLFVALQELRRVMSPTSAFRESPADKGFLPIYFGVPTNRADDYPALAIDQRMVVQPRGLRAFINRNQLGGDDGQALAIPWHVTFVARDPRIMSEVPVEVAFTATKSGTITNRGDYHAPLNLIAQTNSGAVTLVVSIGDSLFTITLPSSTGNRIVRFKGEDKVITVEEEGDEELRFDILSFTNNTTWPLIPQGDSPYSITKSGAGSLAAGTMVWFWESFAG